MSVPEIALHAAEGVVAGQAVGQDEKTLNKRLLPLGKQSHVHRPLTPRKHRAKGNQQQLARIVPGGISAVQNFKILPARTKLLQSFVRGHQYPVQETSDLRPFDEGSATGSTRCPLRLPRFDRCCERITQSRSLLQFHAFSARRFHG
jgi:hypothetical protein